jgi:hypothetical protein
MNDAFLIVGGDWGDSPKSSGYLNKLVGALDYEGVFHNGGKLIQLEGIMEDIEQYDVVLWFPNISNAHEKFLPEIKKRNPKCILVSSKSNMDGKYGTQSLIARALQVKANLLLEFTKGDGKILGSLIDPLGNAFVHKESDTKVIAEALNCRLKKLTKFTRVGSKSIGEEIICGEGNVEFFKLVREYSEVFHDLIHAAFQDRFLGNISFRCMRGFPSFRWGELIYVSQRNVDKRFIGPECMVAVNPERNKQVEFYGDRKPSVDTPIQLDLYKAFPKINYMLHSHVYIEGAPFTSYPIPCGALEEIDEIVNLVGRDDTEARINLKGHGSLVMGSKASVFKDIPYISRTMPELIERK